MYRNDAVVPYFALVFSAALFLMAFLNTRDRVNEVPVMAGAPHPVSVGTIGLMAFGMALFIYGFVGLLSLWLEGSELRPGVHDPQPSTAPTVAGVILSILLVMVSGFFARVLLYSNTTGYNPTALQGGLFAAMMLIIALLLAIYKKFFLKEEVLAESENSDFPW